MVKYNQMECSCKRTSCFGNKMYYFGLLAFRLSLTSSEDNLARSIGTLSGAKSFVIATAGHFCFDI